MFALLCFLLPLFAAQASPANPQPANATAPQSTAPAAAEPMPTDPKALLALAAKKNGLQNVGPAPWHLKATYEVMDDNGVVKETGTFEEFWTSARKYKKSFASSKFTQTEYSTDAGVMRVGVAASSDEAASEVEESFYPPFPKEEAVKKGRFKLKDQKSGGTLLKCVTLDSPAPVSLPPESIHCFAADAPILRGAQSSAGLYDVFYNQLAVFRGIYVARDISINRLGRPFLHIRIDTLGSLPAGTDSTIVAPGSAVPASRRSFTESVDLGKTISKVQPQYPPEARSARVQGAVFVRAIVGMDGAVSEVQAIAGPSMLLDSAMQAVRQWRYEPYLVEGEAVQVQTVIRVVYSLSY